MKTLLVAALALVACGGSESSSGNSGAALAGHWPLSNGAAIDINTEGGGRYFSAADLALLGTCTAFDSTGACTQYATYGDTGALLATCSQATASGFSLTFNGGVVCTDAPAGTRVVKLVGHLTGESFTATLTDSGTSSEVSGVRTGPAWF